MTLAGLGPVPAPCKPGNWTHLPRDTKGQPDEHEDFQPLLAPVPGAPPMVVFILWPAQCGWQLVPHPRKPLCRLLLPQSGTDCLTGRPSSLPNRLSLIREVSPSVGLSQQICPKGNVLSSPPTLAKSPCFQTPASGHSVSKSSRQLTWYKKAQGIEGRYVTKQIELNVHCQILGGR